MGQLLDQAQPQTVPIGLNDELFFYFEQLELFETLDLKEFSHLLKI